MTAELADIKALLERHVAASESRDREQSKQIAELAATVRGLGDKTMALEHRLKHVEKVADIAGEQARKSLDSYDDLNTGVQNHVEALHQHLNARLTKQDHAIARVAEQNATQSKQLEQLVADRTFVVNQLKALKWIVMGAPAAYEAVRVFLHLGAT